MVQNYHKLMSYTSRAIQRFLSQQSGFQNPAPPSYLRCQSGTPPPSPRRHPRFRSKGRAQESRMSESGGARQSIFDMQRIWNRILGRNLSYDDISIAFFADVLWVRHTLLPHVGEERVTSPKKVRAGGQ